MSKLEDEIRARGGCSSLEALLWCQEREAAVAFFADGTTAVDVRADRRAGRTFLEAVLAHVLPVKP